MTKKQWLKNPEIILDDPWRKKALEIVLAGLDVIDTTNAIETSVRLEGEILHVRDQQFDLAQFSRIVVIGFGKASCDAAVAIENILKDKIRAGVVVGLTSPVCENIETYKGTHPHASPQNVQVSEKIKKLAESTTEKDLAIILVSGGGSALLCWPQDECDQGVRLYEKWLGQGGDIADLNTIRKHLSEVKGGGLAKLLYPATVLGLVFSDIPGNDYSMVASGPTYKDTSTVADAQALIDKHGLGDFHLLETPKEDTYFKKVYNIPIVSNDMALEAMCEKAAELGLTSMIVSSDINQDANQTLGALKDAVSAKNVAVAGGEISLVVEGASRSRAGRNVYMAWRAVEQLSDDEIFIALASDGMDNGPAAGAIADAYSRKIITERRANSAIWDPYDFFDAAKSLILTGATGANVADFYILLRKP